MNRRPGGRYALARSERKPECRGPAQRRRRLWFSVSRRRRHELSQRWCGTRRWHRHYRDIMDQVEAVRQRMGSTEANALQVRVELQADCFAGVWANRAQESQKIIKPGDIDEALNAASAIGDDHIQKQTQGYVVPDSFTHGSSEQRVRWFRCGCESG